MTQKPTIVQGIQSMMLPDPDIEEALSVAYIQAICGMAGCNYSIDRKDFGTDITIKDVGKRDSGKLYDTGHNVIVQIKATKNIREDANQINYDLKNKNYNDLALSEGGTKKLLVVLILPPDKTAWLVQNINELILKKCAYYYCLEGSTSVDDNGTTTVVHIPKTNVFSVDVLKRIMMAIKQGRDLHGI